MFDRDSQEMKRHGRKSVSLLGTIDPEIAELRISYAWLFVSFWQMSNINVANENMFVHRSCAAVETSYGKEDMGPVFVSLAINAWLSQQRQVRKPVPRNRVFSRTDCGWLMVSALRIALRWPAHSSVVWLSLSRKDYLCIRHRLL